MNRLARTWLPGAAVLGLAALASPRPLFAQADTGKPAADTSHPAAQPATAPVPTTGVPQYLLTHPRVLNLTPKQTDRIRAVQVWLQGQDSSLRAQWQQLTGGRALRAIPPAERRSLAPQIQPIAQQLRANSAAALDSVDAILSPAQQQRLQAALAEYRERMRARQAQQGQQAPQQ